MRALDERRERTVAELRSGALDGRLTLEAFAFRVDAAFRARTEEELDALVADLPVRGWFRRVGALLQRRRTPAAEIELTVTRSEAALTVGRSRRCDVTVGDATVSNEHAELRRLRDGSWRVRDLGSLHGTWLNGSPVREARVSPGDVLRLGTLRLDLRL